MDVLTSGEIARRWPGNPLIAIQDVPFQCSDVWNAGAVRANGEHLLLVTIEALEGRSSIYLARSRDGHHFRVKDRPFMAAARDESDPDYEYESLGIRDARVTTLDGTHYLTYVADGHHGLRVGLARTDDFRFVERMGYVSQVDTKNGALFPRKIGGRYALLKRPNPGNSIWITYSDDLVFWGSATVVMTPRGGYWDPDRIGAGSTPIEIDEGWLVIYYGEKHTSAGPLVRLGAVILDKDDPSQVLARSNIPILSPREPYERIGDIPNVVFSCGALLDEGGDLRIYYGASDSCICLATASLDDVIRVCRGDHKEF